MASVPLTAAVAAGSARRAVIPGYKSAIVDISTPVSPSDGRTSAMYRRKVAFGPTISTPRLESCSRCV